MVAEPLKETARSGFGWDIVDYDADPPRTTGDHVRDEEEQASYLRRLIGDFEGPCPRGWPTGSAHRKGAPRSVDNC